MAKYCHRRGSPALGLAWLLSHLSAKQGMDVDALGALFRATLFSCSQNDLVLQLRFAKLQSPPHVGPRKGQRFGRFGNLLDVRDKCSSCEMLRFISEVRYEQRKAMTSRRYKQSCNFRDELNF